MTLSVIQNRLHASGATIGHVPPELLGIIFTFVHADSRKETEIFDESLCCPMESTNTDNILTTGASVRRVLTSEQRQGLISIAQSQSFFPYNCASVCTTWRNVLSSYPVFWTRLVLFNDSCPTPLDDAKRYIKWTRNLPLDIIITYRQEHYRFDDEAQKKHVDSFMDLLLPHVSRWRMLHVEANDSASLPSFLSKKFDMDAPLLRDLSFICEENHVLETDESPLRTPISMRCPSLRTVAVDAPNFRRACAYNCHWLNYKLHIEDLVVFDSQFLPRSKAVEKTHRLRLADALDSIATNTNLVNLTLRRIAFDTENTSETHTFILPRLQGLFLEFISPEAIRELFRLCNFPNLTMLHLHASAKLDKHLFVDFSVDVQALFLSLIQREVDIADFLSVWDGAGLCLIKCSWDDDKLIHDLTTVQEPEEGAPAPEGGRNFIGAAMAVLYLMLCPLHSVESLKMLIQARNHYVDYANPNWQTETAFGPAIRTLVVKQPLHAGPLSKEDRLWFMERLVDFVWE